MQSLLGSEPVPNRGLTSEVAARAMLDVELHPAFTVFAAIWVETHVPILVVPAVCPSSHKEPTCEFALPAAKPPQAVIALPHAVVGAETRHGWEMQTATTKDLLEQ